MTILGIDIGLDGAIASIDDSGARVWDLPAIEVVSGGKKKRRISEHALCLTLQRALERCNSPGGAKAYVESAQASTQMGVSSAFSYGVTYGLVRGVLAQLRVPTVLVSPQKWKHAMGLGAKREFGADGSRKGDESLEKARLLFPQLGEDLMLKKNEGRAEALLIAQYGAEENGL